MVMKHIILLQKIYATYVQCCIPESTEVSPNVLYTTVQSKKVAKKEGTREKKTMHLHFGELVINCSWCTLIHTNVHIRTYPHPQTHRHRV